MTTATAVECRKCEASALHLITESDIYGEYVRSAFSAAKHAG